MYFEFIANKHRIRVWPDGSAARARASENDGEFANAERLALTATQRRMLSALVRTTASIPTASIHWEILARCLPPSKDDVPRDSFQAVQHHVQEIRRSFASPGLIGNRRNGIQLKAKVRAVRETKEVPTVDSLYEAANSLTVEPVLLAPGWMMPATRIAGASVNLTEISATRADGEIRAMGFATERFDLEAAKHFVRASEGPVSELFEWAGADNPADLQLLEHEDTGEMLFADPPQGGFKMIIGASGAEAKLTWLDSNGTCAPAERDAQALPIRFTCGKSTYTTADGRCIERKLPGGKQYTFNLGPRPARLLMLLLNQSAIGPLSRVQMWNTVWPERETSEPSPELIRQTIHRVREAFEPESIIKTLGASGEYALNATVCLWMNAGANWRLPDELERIPLRFALPTHFLRYGPFTGAKLKLREIRIARSNGDSPVLGFATDSRFPTLKALLNPSSTYGRLWLQWAGLDEPVKCVPVGDSVWCVGDADRHVFLYPNHSAELEWTAPREPKPGSQLEAVRDELKNGRAAGKELSREQRQTVDWLEKGFRDYVAKPPETELPVLYVPDVDDD